ncbi:hypothetical protein VNO77_28825 [Canavalia gladiata]|uniref:Core Histone H2A/H2B/H3 domain-containing protein n=1 Tax=Canavalia gladiata TaxID=3824 RepID=A0AAN9KZ63_CANGL
MAPKRGKKMVVKSTRKVVEEKVQVLVVGSNKRDVQIGEEVGSGQKKEHVRVIPVHEVTPQANEDGSTTNITTEYKIKQENIITSGQVQNRTNEAFKEQEKAGNDGRRKRRKRRVRRNEEGYQRYVYRVLKQVHPEMGISSQAMTILNNLMNDMFERLADEATKLKTYTGHMTLSSREIQGAVKLVLPGDLGKHAIAEGAKAMTSYTSHHG